MGCRYRSGGEFLGEYELSGHGERWPVPLAEEADQPFDVLCRFRQEELLPNELHSPQAQATQSDLILQFRELGGSLARDSNMRHCPVFRCRF